MTLVGLELAEGIATVTLDRPGALNVLDRAMLDELERVFAELERDASLRAVILTGTGKAFAAGADIRAMAAFDPEAAMAFARRGQQVVDRIAAHPRPVLGALNGFALGGGCELALACDLRIASQSARLGQPEVSLGVLPGFGGTQRLPRLVGPSAAKYLLFTGEVVTAERALALGLVDEVVEPDTLLSRCREIARLIAGRAPLAVAWCKEAVDRGGELPLETALGLEADLFARCFTTGDQREGMAAFLEKRAPSFTAR